MDSKIQKLKNRLIEIWNHTGFQRYFRNTGWMFLGKIGSLAVSFIAIVFIARRLGPGNYGQLSYAVSFACLFSFIASLGIDQILFRDLVRYPEKKNNLLGSSLVIKLLAGLGTLIICMLTALLVNKDAISNVLIFIIASTFIFNAFQIISYEFQARVEAKYPSLISFIVSVVLNVLKIIVIALGKGVIYLALILLLESILYAVFYLYFYRTKLKENIFNWRYEPNTSRALLKDSWPLIISSAFALIYARIDQVMIKNMMDISSVGLYDAAVRLTEVWYFIPNVIISSLFPAIINGKKDSEEKYVNRLRHLFFLLLYLSFGISIVTSLLAKPIISVLYGPAFLGSVAVLQIYIWSNIGTAIGSLCNSYLVAENYRRVVLFSSFAAMSLNVVLNLFFIPRFGIAGAAWATFISYMVTPLSLFLFKGSRRMVGKLFIRNI